MKSAIAKAGCGVVLGAGLALSGCGKAKPTLHVFTWADYVKPELIEQFEAQQGCRVVIDTFDSNEAMYAKLKAGATGYDVVVPSSYMVKVMNEQGMLMPLEREQIPNLANVDREYLKLGTDPDMRHGVPYMVSYTGIAYLKSRVKDMEPTWAVFDRADLAGRMTLLNDMRETIGAALKFLGFSLNTTDDAELAKAQEVAIRWKRQIAKFENEQYKSGLASAEFLVVHGYSGDILQVQSENSDVEFVLPREGFSIACDEMVVLKDAPQPALAHRFINYMHEPAVAAENTAFVQYLCPNRPSYALLSPEVRDNPGINPPPELRAKGEVLLDLGADNAKYVKVWDAIKAAK